MEAPVRPIKRGMDITARRLDIYLGLGDRRYYIFQRRERPTTVLLPLRKPVQVLLQYLCHYTVLIYATTRLQIQTRNKSGAGRPQQNETTRRRVQFVPSSTAPSVYPRLTYTTSSDGRVDTLIHTSLTQDPKGVKGTERAHINHSRANGKAQNTPKRKVDSQSRGRIPRPSLKPKPLLYKVLPALSHPLNPSPTP